MNNREKNRILNKEACITIGLYIFFFIWWYGFAYGLGSKDPSEYSYVLGFPSWFFYSCILGYVVICLLLWFVVKKFFVDVDFDEE
ncbi:MAG: YhdT family protein [Maledivibacter sp.]|jgi:uncharacterized membrane protein YhdT|nr:YhdT family protein [Maledivibacter sp.]